MKRLNSNKKFAIWTFFLVAAIFIISLIDLNIGSSSNANADIILNLRLPHVLCAIIAGIGLACVGCILQATLTNPLASASTMGISQGASTGACIAIVVLNATTIGTFFSLSWTVVFAFLFAIIPTLIIFSLTKANTFSANAIVLSGIAISIFFSGVIAIIQYFADSTQLADIVFWTFGSLRNVDSFGLIIMGVVVIITFIIALMQTLNLNAYESGENLASSVGINISTNRVFNLLVCAICTASICAFCGTINFIGLISPHIMRKLIGANYRKLLPMSALCGAILLLIADVLSAIIIPGAIMPIGAITSLVGAPIFIFVLLKRNSQC